jgi:hypothetical protein
MARTCSSFFETRMVTSERKGSLGAREVDDDDDNDDDEVAAELRRLPDFTVLDRSLGGFGSEMQITLLCSVGERKRTTAGGGRGTRWRTCPY